MSRKFDLDTVQDVAALSFSMAASDLYPRAHDVLERTQGGFTGLYEAAICAGQALEDVAKAMNVEWGLNGDWPGSIDRLAERVLTFMVAYQSVPSDSDVCLKLAYDSIRTF